MGKKNNNKGKRLEVEAATAESADDFDDMLAEYRAADLAIPAAATSNSTTRTTTSATTSTTTLSSSSSSSSSSSPNSSRPEETRVSEDMIIDACQRKHFALLRGDVWSAVNH
jgi:hypothetical protein